MLSFSNIWPIAASGIFITGSSVGPLFAWSATIRMLECVKKPGSGSILRGTKVTVLECVLKLDVEDLRPGLWQMGTL